MTWFWFFTLYSTLGCALEVLFARLTRSRPDRKRALFLPLCPVYGLGACLCLMIAPSVRGNPGLLFLTGAALCTATEYLMALWYERGLGVRFCVLRSTAIRQKVMEKPFCHSKLSIRLQCI